MSKIPVSSKRAAAIVVWVYVVLVVGAIGLIFLLPKQEYPIARHLLAFIIYAGGLPLALWLLWCFVDRINPHSDDERNQAESRTSNPRIALVPDEAAELNGVRGIARSTLRPSGYVVVAGRTYHAVTEGEFIDKDVPVRVIGDKDGALVVREQKE